MHNGGADVRAVHACYKKASYEHTHPQHIFLCLSAPNHTKIAAPAHVRARTHTHYVTVC